MTGIAGVALDLPGAAAGRRGGRAGRRQGGVHDRPADDLPDRTAAGPPSWAGRRSASTGRPRAARATTTCSARSGSGSTRAWPGMKPTKPGYEEIEFKPLIAEDAKLNTRVGVLRLGPRHGQVGLAPDRGRHPDGRHRPAERHRPRLRARHRPDEGGRGRLRHAADRRQRAGRDARRRRGRPRRLRGRLGLLRRSASARASSPPPRSPRRVGGTVPATLSLTLGAAASFGAFTPGRRRGTTSRRRRANVISTAGDATLTVADPSTTATGRLVNGASRCRSRCRPASGPRPTRRFRASLRSWTAPVSNDPVTIDFKQSIGANEAAAHRHVQQDADVHAVDHELREMRRA